MDYMDQINSSAPRLRDKGGVVPLKAQSRNPSRQSRSNKKGSASGEYEFSGESFDQIGIPANTSPNLKAKVIPKNNNYE
jgi:hypothetical protein